MENQKAMCRSAVRKWSHGCYTLVHDTDIEADSWALDSVLYVDCDGWYSQSQQFADVPYFMLNVMIYDLYSQTSTTQLARDHEIT